MRQGHNDRQQQVAIVTFVETFAKFTKCEELIFLLALIPFPLFFCFSAKATFWQSHAENKL